MIKLLFLLLISTSLGAQTVIKTGSTALATTDGDKGDITVSVGGTVWGIDDNTIISSKIAAAAVTLAKIGGAGPRNDSTFFSGDGTFKTINAFNRLSQNSDTSFRLYKPDGTFSTVTIALQEGNKGDITTNRGWSEMLLNNNAVTTAKILDDAVTLAKIAPNAVGSSEIVSTTVTPGAYTNSNITVDADGRITLAANGAASSTPAAIEKLNFLVTAGGTQLPGDSTIDLPFTGKQIEVIRDGNQLTDSSATKGFEWNNTSGVLTVHPPPYEGEKYIVRAYPTAYFTYLGLAAPAGYDASFQAYLTAVEGAGGSLTTAQKNAYNSFVVSLKAAAIFTTHFDFIHLLTGGSEAATKFNLVDPVNTDAGYRATFLNAATFASTGVSTNGTNQLINPHYIMGATGTKAGEDDYHVGVYNRTATAAAGFTFGVKDGTGSVYSLIRATDNNSYFKNINTGEGSFADATSGKGFYLTQMRSLAPASPTHKDGVQKLGTGNNGNAILIPTIYKLFFNAYNNEGVTQQYRAGELSIISAGKSFTDTQRAAYESAVATLVSTLAL